MFTVTPMEGVLLPHVAFKASVDFLCKKPASFSKVPIFRCTFSYPEYSMVIDSFVVTASAKVHLPKYELYPSDEMHFDYQLIETEKCQEMIIKNTGSFDFNYVIQSLRDILAEKDKKKGKGGKKGGSKSQGKLKATSDSKSTGKKSKSDKSSKTDTKSSKKTDKSSKKASSKASKDSKGSKKK